MPLPIICGIIGLTAIGIGVVYWMVKWGNVKKAQPKSSHE